ncbi:PLP-dependent transferase [Pleomassaria siparia CBS 279.74]|uniref:PLP-dependent transferase n=1 Tax=Pleomassaria siparia CBS 279.74 TaxID=1314801 RepID=A0A6G1KRM6_9PLEO|nr:PLP-dependent transferase [Pleomassaria siparia CBS 279.74]
MDSGLSTRMSTALQELIPKLKAVAPHDLYDPTTAIDLSCAQNEMLREELIEFLKTTVEKKTSKKVFELPDANGGDVVLRNALASFFNTYFKPIHAVSPEHIVITAGASDAIENLIHAVCDEGDSVIVPGPYWYGLDTILKGRANVNIVVAHPPTYRNYDNYLLPSLQAAYDFSADRSRIKAVLICNPSNPLSRCYPKKSLVECMEFCQERGLHLISDELYALTGLKGAPDDAPPFVSALSLTEPLVPSGAVKVDPSRVHMVWSASKLFGSSGFRVGCLISQQNPQLLAATSLTTTDHVSSIASLYLSSLLAWSQLPTLLALNSERLSDSYRLLAAALRQWKVDFILPTHGLFLFAKLAKDSKTARDETAFFDRLAMQGIRVGHGQWYRGVEGDFGWARIRFSVDVDVMMRALSVFSTFLKSEGFAIS